MAKKVKELKELEQIVDEANDIRNWMDQAIEDHNLVLETIKTMIKDIQKIQLTLDILREEMFIQKELKEKPEKVIRQASPGFKNIDVTTLGIHTDETRRVVEYTKNNGEIGLKIQGGDVLYENKAYKYLQECKYGCGNYISFDNYKKGQKALHISPDLNVIGRYCPKYE